jgi:two-component system response regulator HydG
MSVHTIKPTVLIVDDNSAYLDAMRRALSAEYEVLTAASAEDALGCLSPPPDIAMLDVRLREGDPQDKGGIQLLDRLREEVPQLPVVMATAHGDVDIAIECIRHGATDFLQKHRAGPEEVSSRLSIALRHSRTVREKEELKRQVEGREIVGVSSHIRDLKHTINILAENSYADVLILGEQGTGKELVARAIHANGPRASAPFVAFSLAALSFQVLESELFGHERGSFTDAKDRRIGLIESAHKGVLFLDEIGDIDLGTQAKLLRVLAEREVMRVGTNTPVKIDLQILAATNARLAQKMEEGTFRRDLFDRLNTFNIRLLPLRERPDDIPALIDHFSTVWLSKGRRVSAIAPTAQDALMGYQWPGNVRELKSALESAQIHAQINGHSRIERADLPAEVIGRRKGVQGQPGEIGFDIDEALIRHELSYIREALRAAKGIKSVASRLLGYGKRHILPRRIAMIRKRYPAIIAEFPDLAESNAPGTPKVQKGGPNPERVAS